MALPLPNEARTGAPTAHSNTAENLYNSYTWIAKLSKEIQRENNTINLHTLNELDRMGQLFMAEITTATLEEKKRNAIEHHFRNNGVTWPLHTNMEADFWTLRNTLVLLNGAVNELPEISDPQTGVVHYTRSSDGTLNENFRTINKAIPQLTIENAVDLVANLFEAEGAP